MLMRALLLSSALAWLLASLMIWATAAHGDQSDPQLPSLFQALKQADSPREAEPIEMRIWSIWMTSADKTVNDLLESGGQAMAAGRLDEAVAAYSRIIERAPGFAEGWNKRATARYLQRNFAASMLDIRQTLVLEPKHFGAISGMGLIFMESGDLRGALGAFEHVLSIHPSAPAARRYRDVLKKELGAGGA